KGPSTGQIAKQLGTSSLDELLQLDPAHFTTTIRDEPGALAPLLQVISLPGRLLTQLVKERTTRVTGPAMDKPTLRSFLPWIFLLGGLVAGHFDWTSQRQPALTLRAA